MECCVLYEFVAHGDVLGFWYRYISIFYCSTYFSFRIGIDLIIISKGWKYVCGIWENKLIIDYSVDF